MARHTRLSDEQVQARLGEVPGWSVVDGKLERELRFDDFAEAFAFMTGLALVAERLDHHPEWCNVYNRVTIRLKTHDVDGLSDLDFRMAARADALLA